MRVAIILSLALSMVAAQAVVTSKNWVCCKTGSNYEPQIGTSCPSGRRLQAMVAPYCPHQLKKSSRRLQALQLAAPPTCSNLNGRRRRMQAMVETNKCPVNVEGVQCFKNNTNANC